jgi:hypothetical protein
VEEAVGGTHKKVDAILRSGLRRQKIAFLVLREIDTTDTCCDTEQEKVSETETRTKKGYGLKAMSDVSCSLLHNNAAATLLSFKLYIFCNLQLSIRIIRIEHRLL